MALTVTTNGTTAALTVGGPETTLTTQTPGAPLVYVARVDVSALAAGENVSLLIYTKTLSGGTERLEDVVDFIGNGNGGGPQAVRSFPCPTDISFRAALLQANGTGRTFPWKVFSL